MRIKTIVEKDFSREVGFITPTKNWSKERKEEFKLLFPMARLYDLKGEVK